jgi:hypothetical protein
MNGARHRAFIGLTLGVLALLPIAPTLAQGAPAQGQPAVRGTAGRGSTATAGVETSAGDVRRELMAVLKLYPPSLGSVLRADPSLLSNDTYLAAYPALVTYLTAHPEIRRNPEYFFAEFDRDYYYGRYRSEAARIWEDMMTGVFILVIVATMLGAFGWIVRTLIDYRRWHRLSKTQNDVHAKLLDRFTANDELIAYVQSPAGSRFLQSAPIMLDAGPRAPGAPFGRILWSIQAGLVLAAAGLGLQYVSGRVTDLEMREPLFTMGILALSLGIGFVVAAAVSFGLSKRLGLFDTPVAPPYESKDVPRGTGPE